MPEILLVVVVLVLAVLSAMKRRRPAAAGHIYLSADCYRYRYGCGFWP